MKNSQVFTTAPKLNNFIGYILYYWTLLTLCKAKMTYANAFICLFLFLGACFGFASYANRHLFSEGPQKATTSNHNSFLESRIFWIMVCTWLWPIMVITGINTALILSKRKKQAQKNTSVWFFLNFVLLYMVWDRWLNTSLRSVMDQKPIPRFLFATLKATAATNLAACDERRPTQFGVKV